MTPISKIIHHPIEIWINIFTIRGTQNIQHIPKTTLTLRHTITSCIVGERDQWSWGRVRDRLPLKGGSAVRRASVVWGDEAKNGSIPPTRGGCLCERERMRKRWHKIRGKNSLSITYPIGVYIGVYIGKKCACVHTHTHTHAHILIHITHTQQPLYSVRPLYLPVQILGVTHGTLVGQCIARWTHTP